MDLASLLVRLTALRQQALPAVEKADDPDELDAVEAAYLGRNGELRKLLANIGQLSGEDRPKVGAAANPIREELEAAIAARRARLDSIALDVRLARGEGGGGGGRRARPGPGAPAGRGPRSIRSLRRAARSRASSASSAS